MVDLNSDSNPGLTPSANTVWTLVGGVIATTIVVIFHKCGIDFPAGYEVSLGGAIAVIAGYLHRGGRI